MLHTYSKKAKQMLKKVIVKLVSEPGQTVKFPALFIHVCYNAYWESALTEPELFKHLPANIPFPHLTLKADLTYFANKHKFQFSKGTFTHNMVICHVDVWLRLE